MSEKHTCCAKIYMGLLASKRCDKGAAHEYEGNWYCKTHHPPTVKAKREASYAKWKSEREEERAKREAAAEAAVEQKRKADAYDQLAERNAELVETLRSIDTRLRICIKGPISAAEAYDSFYQELVTAALAKCQPKPQEVKP